MLYDEKAVPMHRENGGATPDLSPLESVATHPVDQKLPLASQDPNDPLNWTWTEKHLVLLVVAAMAFQGPFAAAAASTALVQQAEAYGVLPTAMLSSITVQTVGLCIGNFFWVPIADTYGRRPVYMASAIVACLGTLGCSITNTLGGFIGARLVNGLGCAASMALGSQTVKDLFFHHERGQKMGLWTLSMSSAPYLSTILDGAFGEYSNWRWSMWLTFFMWAALLIPCALLPETRFDRRYDLQEIHVRETWLQRLKWKRFEGNLTAAKFYRPLFMIKYPSITLIAIYYGNVYGFVVFGFFAILPFAFPANYGFRLLAIGLVGFAPLVGTLLGEPMAGPFSDWVVRFLAHRNGGIRHPEQRLQALWLGAVLVPIGLIIFGTSLEYKIHWIVPCIGIGIASFALQSVTTISYSYPVDCYEGQAGDAGMVINFGRNVFAFNIVFYIHEFVERVGYAWVFGIYAILSVALFLPIIALMIWGKQWRLRLGIPHSD